jgi:hypothetical protein
MDILLRAPTVDSTTSFLWFAFCVIPLFPAIARGALCLGKVNSKAAENKGKNKRKEALREVSGMALAACASVVCFRLTAWSSMPWSKRTMLLSVTYIVGL